MTEERKAAAVALERRIRELGASGVLLNRPVVLPLAADPVSEVLARCARYDSPVLAVYESGVLRLLEVSPVGSVGDRVEAGDDGAAVEPDRVVQRQEPS